jgi:segregation and condensation protein B
MSQSEIEQPAESPEEQVDAQAETLPGVVEQAQDQSETAPGDETVAVSFSAEEILGAEEPAESDAPMPVEDATLRATLEAIIYVTDEPLTVDQIAEAIEQPRDRVVTLLEQLSAEYDKPDRGLSIREIAGGFRMTTKAEHHEAVRRFVRNLNPPMKLSLPALETLAVIAYKQPITAPEIMEIRGVQGAGVLKTLLDRKLIAPAGRKQVIGKPILYKTTKEFLVQFGLKNLQELPTLKEFQEIGSLSGGEPEAPVQANLIEMPAPPDQDEAAEGEAQEVEAAEMESAESPNAESEQADTENNPAEAAEGKTE